MEEHTKTIESLLEKTVELGKTSLELARLKAVDKASEVISTIIPNVVVIILMIIFLLFLNIGLSLWIGEILDRMFFGFFIVAGFYCLTALFLHIVLRKRFKRCLHNNFIQLLLK